MQNSLLNKLISKKLIHKYKWELIFIAVTTVIHILILVLPTQLAYGDLAPFPENFKQGARDFFYAWRDVSFGLYRHPGNIMNLLQSLLVVTFGSALIAQKIYVIYLLPLLSFSAARHLLKKHFGAEDNLFLFVLAVFYTFSPTMLTEFVGGTLYSTMLIFAVIPYLASLSLDIIVTTENKINFFRSQIYKSSLWLLLTLSLLFSINIQSVFIYGIFIGIVLLGALLFTSHVSLKSRILNTLKSGLILLFIMIAALAANPIYTLSNFKIINPTPQFDSDAGFINSYSIFLNDVKYTYSRSTLLNTLRLGGNLSDFRYTKLTYWTLPFLILALTTLIYSMYVFKRAPTKRKIFIAGYIFTSLFLYLTYLEITHPVFLKFPVLFMFRNPAKLTLLNTLFFYVCFFEVFKKIPFPFSRFIYAGIYISIFIYIWPIFLGDRGLAYTRNEFTIPKEYYAISDVIRKDAQTNDFRTIWLPSTYEEQSIKLTWIDRERIEDQLGLSEFSTDNFGSYIVRAISNSIIDNDKELFLKLLRTSNIQYLILAKDKSEEIKTNEFYNITSLNSGYKTISAFLSRDKIIFENRDYEVYKLETLPVLFTVDKVNELNFRVGSSPSILRDYYKNNDLPLVKKSSQTLDLITAKTDNNDLSNHILEWDEFWVWPQPKINPQNPVFNLLLFKEKFGFNLRNDAITKVNFSTWIIANRATEIEKYHLRGSALDKTLNNIEFYKNYIKDYYQNSNINNDLDRDTAVKAIVFLSRAQKSMEINSYVLDDVISLLNGKITESYKNLCITSCIKVTADKDGNYQQLEKDSVQIQLKSGSNNIDITPEKNILEIGGQPSTMSPRVYEINNLILNRKYVLEFDYETKGAIYELSLFNQYRNTVNYRYDYDVYLEQTLTSEVKDSKHFRAFFVAKSHPQAITVLKIELTGKSPNKNINISNISITPLPARSISLISSDTKLDTSKEMRKSIEFTKVSPSEYKLKATSLSENLVFAQNYNIGWKLYLDNKTEIGKDNHQLINTYGNLWKINPDELKDTEYVTLKFEPQKELEYSLILSGLFLVAVLVLITKYQKDIKK